MKSRVKKITKRSLAILIVFILTIQASAVWAASNGNQSLDNSPTYSASPSSDASPYSSTDISSGVTPSPFADPSPEVSPSSSAAPSPEVSQSSSADPSPEVSPTPSVDTTPNASPSELPDASSAEGPSPSANLQQVTNAESSTSVQTETAVSLLNLEDTFDTQQWTTYGGTWTYSDGKLNVDAGAGYKTILNNKTFSNFTYEADVSVGSTSGDSGIIFRVSNPTTGMDSYNGYYAGIDSRFNRLVLGKANGWWTQIGSYSTPINVGSTYHIKVVADGSNINVYLADMSAPKISVVDSTYSAGSIGVRTYYNIASFDNIEVMETNSTYNLAYLKSYTKSEEPDSSYQDVYNCESTDGVIEAIYQDGYSYGYRIPSGSTKKVDIVIDLQETDNVQAINAHTMSGIWGYIPDSINISLSTDGVNYVLKDTQTSPNNNWFKSNLGSVGARYVTLQRYLAV